MAPQSDKVLEIDFVYSVCALIFVLRGKPVFHELFQMEGSDSGAAQAQLFLEFARANGFILRNKEPVNFYGCARQNLVRILARRRAVFVRQRGGVLTFRSNSLNLTCRFREVIYGIVQDELLNGTITKLCRFKLRKRADLEYSWH